MLSLLCELVSAPLSPQPTLALPGTMWHPVHKVFPMCVNATHITNVGAAKKCILAALTTGMQLWIVFLKSLHGYVERTICLIQIPCYLKAPHFGLSRKILDFHKHSGEAVRKES